MAKIEMTDDEEFRLIKSYLMQLFFNDSKPIDIEERMRKIEHLKRYHEKLYNLMCELDEDLSKKRVTPQRFEAVLNDWMYQKKEKKEFMIIDKGNHTIN